VARRLLCNDFWGAFENVLMHRQQCLAFGEVLRAPQEIGTNVGGESRGSWLVVKLLYVGIQRQSNAFSTRLT
jgi:hypothetical protein